VAATPSRTTGILESITRESLMELLTEMGIPVQERDIDRTELYVADEAFLCGTLMEIEAIASVDHFTLGDGGAGPITRKLQERFEEVVRGRNPRYANWLTPVYAQAAVQR
jgi:branched-chain amino acid aminotransferase